MFKKMICFMMALAMLLSLAACGGDAAPAQPQEQAAVPETAATSPVETEAPIEETSAPTEPPKPWVNNVMADNSYAAPNYYYEDMMVPGYPEINPEKSGITSITILDTLADMPADARDASQAKDGSVMSWLDGTDLYIAGEGGVMAPKNSTFLLGTYLDVTEINLNGNLHTEQAESMNGMFHGDAKLVSLDLSTFDTSNVTDMAFMFIACHELKTLNLSTLDTSNVTDMNYMFAGVSTMISLDLSSLDTSSVVDMSNMFNGCLQLETLNLNGWDTSNVEDMSKMFIGLHALKELDVSHFNTSNVMNMNSMFLGCESLPALDVSGFDTSYVVDMTDMFDQCNSLKDIKMGEWEIDSVEEYKGFMNHNAKVDGQPWKNLFANVTKKESNLPKVNASNVITAPGIPEDGYNLTVHRNVPLNRVSKKAAKTIPNLESILIDDIPIILISEETSDSMPIYIDLHAGGGTKEDRLGTLQNVAYRTGGYAVSIDAGACGESQRGKMTDGEAICMLVTDIEKVIAFCSTLPGADLSRIMIHGNSMGAVGAFSYLARGAFKPIYVSLLSCGADLTGVTPSSPVSKNHGEGKRDIPALTNAQLRELLAGYSPLQHTENMMDTFLCLCAGSQDADGSVDALEEKFKEMGKENYSINWYDAGHDLPGEAYDIATNLMLETLANAQPIDNPAPKVTVTEVTE